MDEPRHAARGLPSAINGNSRNDHHPSRQFRPVGGLAALLGSNGKLKEEKLDRKFPHGGQTPHPEAPYSTVQV